MSDELARLTKLELRHKDIYPILDTPEWAEIQKDIDELARQYKSSIQLKMEASDSSPTSIAYNAGRLAAIQEVLEFPSKARENSKKEYEELKAKTFSKQKKKNFLDKFKEL